MDLVKLNQIYAKIILTLEFIKIQCANVTGFECSNRNIVGLNVITISIIEKSKDVEPSEKTDVKSKPEPFITIPYDDIDELELTAEAVMLGLISKYIYNNSTDNIFKKINEDNGTQNISENEEHNRPQEESAGENESGEVRDLDLERPEPLSEGKEAESKESDWETNGERAGRKTS